MPSGVYTRKDKAYYTFYDNVTDEILWFGTAQELVDKGQFKNIHCVHTLVTNIRKGRNTGVTVVIDKESVDDD